MTILSNLIPRSMTLQISTIDELAFNRFYRVSTHEQVICLKEGATHTLG